MGRCIGFGYAMWATAWGNVKICDNFRSVGHSARFGYVLWAIVQDLVMCYGPQRRNLLCVMGCSTGFCHGLWAIVQDLVMRYGP
jgi:hypothetical protein